MKKMVFSTHLKICPVKNSRQKQYEQLLSVESNKCSEKITVREELFPTQESHPDRQRLSHTGRAA